MSHNRFHGNAGSLKSTFARARCCRAAVAARWATGSPPRPPMTTAPAIARMTSSACNQQLLLLHEHRFQHRTARSGKVQFDQTAQQD